MIIFDLRRILEVATLTAAGGLLHGIPEAGLLVLLLEFSVDLLDERGPLRHLARLRAT